MKKLLILLILISPVSNADLAIIGAAATATGTPTTADGMLISGLSLAQSHTSLKMSSAFDTGLITGKVTSMLGMFEEARGFNQDIRKWDTSSVVNMSQMFYNNTTFKYDISGWNTKKVTNFSYMWGKSKR
jgi:surface protein